MISYSCSIYQNSRALFLFIALGLLIGSAPAAAAQADSPLGAAAIPAGKAPAARLQFEVATIKPASASEQGVMVYPGGRIRIQSTGLAGLIFIAFNLRSGQLSGADKWMGEDEYDVEAIPPAEMQSSIDTGHTVWGIGDERLRQMLQALLIDRFQLRFHRETKTGDVYLLEKSGKPIRLRPAANSGYSGVEFTAATWLLFNTSMPQLAKFASDAVFHRPVLDRTGLTGSFDYRSPTQLGPDQRQIDLAGAFPTLLSELGLKVRPAKGPVESFVIDHAEKPSPN